MGVAAGIAELRNSWSLMAPCNAARYGCAQLGPLDRCIGSELLGLGELGGLTRPSLVFAVICSSAVDAGHPGLVVALAGCLR
jgi:hypothetical protein